MTETTAPKTEQAAVDHYADLGHGNSPAAWTTVFVMTLGALVSCIAFVIGPDATLVFWLGIAVMAIGLIIGLVMRSAGYGVGGSKLKNAGH